MLVSGKGVLEFRKRSCGPVVSWNILVVHSFVTTAEQSNRLSMGAIAKATNRKALKVSLLLNCVRSKSNTEHSFVCRADGSVREMNLGQTGGSNRHDNLSE